MKAFFAILLWALAAVLAVAVLWRLWRGKPIVLRGRWAPRIVRMVAVILVFMGLGADRATSAPVTPTDGKKGKVDDSLPPHITSTAVGKWLVLQQRTSDWFRFKQSYTIGTQRPQPVEPGVVELAAHLTKALPERLRDLMIEDLKAMTAGKPAAASNPRDLSLALEEAEAAGYIDPWLASTIWRRTSNLIDHVERKPLIDLYARLHRHSRMANSLIAAGGRVRPLMQQPIAWGSKAGPRPPRFPVDPTAQLLQAGPGVYAALRTGYPAAEPGTWDNQGLTIFGVEKGSAPLTMIRAGQAGVPQTEGMVRFGRLDLLETTPGDKPVLIKHPVLGTLEIPAGKIVSVWQLPLYLSAAGKERVKKLVADALSGKEAEARLLEKHLPLTASTIREGLKSAPREKGSPLLRLILTQFDDVPPSPPALGGPPHGFGEERVFPGGGGGVGGGGGNRGGGRRR